MFNDVKMLHSRVIELGRVSKSSPTIPGCSYSNTSDERGETDLIIYIYIHISYHTYHISIYIYIYIHIYIILVYKDQFPPPVAMKQP